MVKIIGLMKNDDWLLRIAEWRNDPRCRGVLLTPYVTAVDINKQREWADKVIWSEAEHFYYIVENVQKPFKPELLGYCGLIKVHMIPRTAELSILVDPDKMGKGIGGEAVMQLLKVGFMEFGLNCIYVDCYTNNTRNEFFEKQGFQEEGRLRARKYWDGRWYDSIMMSITRADYDKRGN